MEQKESPRVSLYGQAQCVRAVAADLAHPGRLVDRYVLSEDARRLALFFVGTYRRITLPALAQLALHPSPQTPLPLARA